MAKWQWDEILLACDLVAENNWKELRPGDSQVIALSKFLRSQATSDVLHSDPDFRNPNGVSRKTTDVMTAHPDYVGARTKGGRTTPDVVLAYLSDPVRYHDAATELRTTAGLGRAIEEAVGGPIEVEPTSIEGRVIHRLIRTRERDPKLRAIKIKQALAQSDSLACEVCTFDFKGTYGALGEGYIHVHHVVPLHASGVVRNSLNDLVLVCANCHVMLHRGQTWRTPDELRGIVGLAAQV